MVGAFLLCVVLRAQVKEPVSVICSTRPLSSHLGRPRGERRERVRRDRLERGLRRARRRERREPEACGGRDVDEVVAIAAAARPDEPRARGADVGLDQREVAAVTACGSDARASAMRRVTARPTSTAPATDASPKRAAPVQEAAPPSSDETNSGSCEEFFGASSVGSPVAPHTVRSVASA